MTVIAYKNGILATDTLSVNNTNCGHEFNEEMEKVITINKMCYIAIPGEFPNSKLLEEIKDLCIKLCITDKPNVVIDAFKFTTIVSPYEEFNIILITKTKQIMLTLVIKSIIYKEVEDNVLITSGTGADYVIVADRYGMGIKEATLFALNNAQLTGGRLMVYKREDLM